MFRFIKFERFKKILMNIVSDKQFQKKKSYIFYYKYD